MLHNLGPCYLQHKGVVNLIIGYARTSTFEQTSGLEAQIQELTAAGCTKIFSEQVSSVDMEHRLQLEKALDYIREGDSDVFVVTKLDRFPRSLETAIALEKGISAKGASLKILAMGIDTGTATGKLMFNVLSSVAEFERQIMLERQREGISRAKTQGKFKGRKPTVRLQAREIRRLKTEERLSNAEIARRLKVHRSNVGRVLKLS
jgi:DNA invertase Pin-like site-specific DNA recombinase